jgi:hypothetical protein
MYILGLRSSWGTSRVRPSWFPSGHIYWLRLCPHSGERTVRSRPCPEDAVYSLNDSSSYFTQRLFPPSGFSPTYSEYLIIIHGNGIHSYYTSHSYVLYIHPHIIHHIHLYIHIFIFFISSALRGRLAALDSLSPIQRGRNVQGRNVRRLIVPVPSINSLIYSNIGS